MLPAKYCSAPYHPFSAWAAPPEQLERLLVGATPLLLDLLARLATTDLRGSPPHVLLTGPRGIGKTHLLALIHHYVSGRLPWPADSLLPNPPWTAILLTEEEYASHDSLAAFLLSVTAKLSKVQPTEHLWSLPDDVVRGDDRAVCDCCFERLEKAFRDRHSRVLVLLDNLQKVLSSWTEDDQQRFRAFLSRSACMLIFATAPSVFKQVLGQQAVFHDFFEVEPLTELSSAQVLDLLARMFAAAGKQREFEARRVDLERKSPAIQTLVGGNPRLVVFLFEVATRSRFLEIEAALRALLEGLREYFVRRFDDLPSQARKILDTLARMPGPATPTQIALAARLPRPGVNTQLRRLAKAGYVRPVKLTRGRDTPYDVVERLFRIWRQTADVAGRQRFRLLVDFLKLYYTPDEVWQLYQEHRKSLEGLRSYRRDEILPIVETLFYFQSASEGPLRGEIFTKRIDELLRLGEFRWAEQEAAHLAGETMRTGDLEARKAAHRAQARIHAADGRINEVENDLGELVRLNDWEGVLFVGRALVQLRPESAHGWLCIGIAAGSLSRDAEALAAFEQATSLKPDFAEAWFGRGEVLHRLGRHNEVLVALKKAVSLKPDFAEAWFNMGAALERLCSHGEALAAFERTISLKPDFAEAWSRKGWALDNLGRHEEALAALEKATSLRPDSAQAWSNKGSALDNLGRPDAALAAYQKATSLNPDFAEAWSNMGVALQRLGRGAEALAACAKATSLKPDFAEAWANRSGALHMLGRDEESLAALEKAISLKPDLAKAWSNMGLALRSLGRQKEALEAFQRAISLQPDHAAAWLNMGAALLMLDRLEEAVAAYEKVISLKPDFAEAWLSKGLALGRLGRHNEALVAFDMAITLKPDYTEAWFNKGVALRMTSRFDVALTAFDKAINLRPDYAEAWFDKGLSSGELGQTDEALAAFENATILKTDFAEAWFNRSVALHLLGRNNEALATFERVIALNPDDATARNYRSVVLRRLGRYDEALAAMDEAKRAGLDARQFLFEQRRIHLCAGHYPEALNLADQNPEEDHQGWEQFVHRAVAEACLGEMGPVMEALPAALDRATIPAVERRALFQFILEIGLAALRRGERMVTKGLCRTVLAVTKWQDQGWFGLEVGAFLRQVLELEPSWAPEMIGLIEELVRDPNPLALLEPYRRALEFVRKGDPAVLQELFPEVRELVAEIVGRMSPRAADRLPAELSRSAKRT